jgi:outer membrane lipoprotein-sorting protein
MLEKEMFFNKKKIILIYLLILLPEISNANIKENIIYNLQNTQNLNFDFEQNVNGKIETGNCTIEYPKKIFCRYNLEDKKVLISDGKSLVINSKFKSYYKYPIDRTPLNYILDKEFLVKKIRDLDQRIVNDEFINFTIFKNDNEINIFFDKIKFDLIGWQTIDIYQNLNITYISSIQKNRILKKNLFKLPEKD